MQINPIVLIVLSPNQQNLSALRSPRKSACVPSPGRQRRVWSLTRSSWSARSSKHTTRKTLSGCTGANNTHATRTGTLWHAYLNTNRKSEEATTGFRWWGVILFITSTFTHTHTLRVLHLLLGFCVTSYDQKEEVEINCSKLSFLETKAIEETGKMCILAFSLKWQRHHIYMEALMIGQQPTAAAVSFSPECSRWALLLDFE